MCPKLNEINAFFSQVHQTLKKPSEKKKKQEKVTLFIWICYCQL